MNSISFKKIAILGSTGHIAKNLIVGLTENTENFEIILFARSIDKLKVFLSNNGLMEKVTVLNYDLFGKSSYDVIINCVGIGDPGKLAGSLESIFYITEYFDNLILDYIKLFSDTLYINFSSGAAYCFSFDEPGNENSSTELYINKLSSKDFYGIAKMNSEAKHRFFDSLNIVDLRVFGFFSRFIDLHSKYFMTELISCLQKDKILETSSINIVRDYVHPTDLVSLVKLCILQQKINQSFDVYSIKSVEKFQILDFFMESYGLKYKIIEETSPSITGIKKNYYSNNKLAEIINYKPKYNSLKSLIEEYNAIDSIHIS